MTNTPRKSDKWIPWYFVAFFAILAMIQGVFIIIATSTHTGVVTNQAYEKGLQYNKIVVASELQNELGWNGEMDFDGDLLSFQVRNAGNRLLSSAAVIAHLIRPTQEGHDFSVRLEEDDLGIYRSKIIFPLKGLWDIRVVVEWNNQNYQQHKRIIVK